MALDLAPSETGNTFVSGVRNLYFFDMFIVQFSFIFDDFIIEL